MTLQKKEEKNSDKNEIVRMVYPYLSNINDVSFVDGVMVLLKNQRDVNVIAPMDLVVVSSNHKSVTMTDGYYTYIFDNLCATTSLCKKAGTQIKKGALLGITGRIVGKGETISFSVKRNGVIVDVTDVLKGDAYQRPNDFCTRKEVVEIFNYLKKDAKNNKK